MGRRNQIKQRTFLDLIAKKFSIRFQLNHSLKAWETRSWKSKEPMTLTLIVINYLIPWSSNNLRLNRTLQVNMLSMLRFILNRCKNNLKIWIQPTFKITKNYWLFYCVTRVSTNFYQININLALGLCAPHLLTNSV